MLSPTYFIASTTSTPTLRFLIPCQCSIIGQACSGASRSFRSNDRLLRIGPDYRLPTTVYSGAFASIQTSFQAPGSVRIDSNWSFCIKCLWHLPYRSPEEVPLQREALQSVVAHIAHQQLTDQRCTEKSHAAWVTELACAAACAIAADVSRGAAAGVVGVSSVLRTTRYE